MNSRAWRNITVLAGNCVRPAAGQFVALMLGQLAGRRGLRDIEANMSVQHQRLCHLGTKPIARSSVTRLNERQPYQLYCMKPCSRACIGVANGLHPGMVFDSTTGSTRWMPP